MNEDKTKIIIIDKTEARLNAIENEINNINENITKIYDIISELTKNTIKLTDILGENK